MHTLHFYLLAYSLIAYCNAAVNPVSPRQAMRAGWLTSVAGDHWSCQKDAKSGETARFTLNQTQDFNESPCQTITKDAHRNVKIAFGKSRNQEPQNVSLFSDENCSKLAYYIHSQPGGVQYFQKEYSSIPLPATPASGGAWCIAMDKDKENIRSIIVF